MLDNKIERVDFELLRAQEAVIQWLSHGGFIGAKQALQRWPTHQKLLSAY